jgi:hypothetical protein
MAKLLKRKESTPEEVESAKAGAEAINKALPQAVSGRAAVLKKREQFRKLDEVMKE